MTDLPDAASSTLPDTPASVLRAETAQKILCALQHAQQRVTEASDLIRDYYVELQYAIHPPADHEVPTPHHLTSTPEANPSPTPFVDVSSRSNSPSVLRRPAADRPRRRHYMTPDATSKRPRFAPEPPSEPPSEPRPTSHPWTEDDIEKLRAMKLDTVARPSWQAVAARLKRPESDCRAKWNLIKPPKTSSASTPSAPSKISNKGKKT